MQPLAFNSTDILFVSDLPKVCRRCGLASTDYYFATEDGSDGGYLCSLCKYELNPPEIHLQIIQNHIYPRGGLYNPHTQRYETIFKLDDFLQCGWFIKKKWVYGLCDNASIRFQSHIVEAVMLRYYGDRRCKRVERYNFWPLATKMCKCVYCDPGYSNF
jgi:hypothetical protein